ncbi:MAG: hypothetical protein LBN98_01520 [Prevotellaceae bacterium]|jgi:hypothetical protein|nr:hypothetical protein [Prevotellaceae bacterium]
MKYFVLIKISIALLGLSACAPAITKGFRKAGETTVAAQDLYPFWAPQQTHLFAMKIDFRQHHFSGLLLAKQAGEGYFRIVFNTHFGMGVFDFEFRRDTFLIHSCMEELRHRKILKLLEKDFRTLFFLDMKPRNNKAAVYYSPRDASLEINRINGRYYLKNNTQKTLLKTETSQGAHTGYYDFTDYHNRFPETITIKHSGIHLQIVLEKIHNPPGK